MKKVVEMGAEKSWSLNQRRGKRGNNKAASTSTQVIMNVYDVFPVNSYMYWAGFGIFHSGIQVDGKEYGFGPDDLPVSGVYEVEPRRCPVFIFRCSIKMGRISMHPSEFRAIIDKLNDDYHGDTYNVIWKNSNHFADDMSSRLTGRHAPAWVNRVARLGSICSFLVPERQVTTVKQLPKYHEGSEYDDGDVDQV